MSVWCAYCVFHTHPAHNYQTNFQIFNIIKSMNSSFATGFKHTYRNMYGIHTGHAFLMAYLAKGRGKGTEIMQGQDWESKMRKWMNQTRMWTVERRKLFGRLVKCVSVYGIFMQIKWIWNRYFYTIFHMIFQNSFEPNAGIPNKRILSGLYWHTCIRYRISNENSS